MNTETRKTQKEEVGFVKSDKMNKTVVVEVTRKIRHEKYGKVINRRKKYYAHDELDTAVIGDTVRIVETRPLSKLKRWRVVEIVKKAKIEANVLVKE